MGARGGPSPFAASGAAPPVPEISLVIPVFNSETFVERTIDACIEFCERRGTSFELVLVNDGSEDGTWEVVRRRSLADPRLLALDLLRNYGQHSAVWCGLAHARGRRVVTLDDDLQNPPDQIAHLLAVAEAGADVVFGRPRRKRHGLVRRLASGLIDRINTAVFGKRRDLVLTNFRLLDRSVVDRILAHPVGWPYVNGLAVLYGRRPANATVEHAPRREGRSGYGPRRALSLVGRILFGYSALPLRAASLLGLSAAALSFGLGCYWLLKALVTGTTVPGWASVVVLLSLCNGVVLLVLGVLGEYVVRLVRHVGRLDELHVVEVAGGGRDGA